MTEHHDEHETPGEPSETPYRVYALNLRREPEFLAAADDASLGELLRDLRGRERIGDGTRVGIMYRPIAGEPGEWLVNPWT